MKVLYRLQVLLLILLAPLRAYADWEAHLLPAEFQHKSSMQEAMVLAEQANKDIIVYYTRTNCPPCNRLQAQLRQQPIRDLFGGRFVFTAVWSSSMNGSERDHYRQNFGVRGAPTLIVHRKTGEYVCTSVGSFNNENEALEVHKAISEKLKAKAVPPASAPVPCV